MALDPKALRFRCTECGRCCTGQRGYVWVTEAEITALANQLELEVDEFGRRFLRRVGERYALLENGANGDCVFLRDKRCQVYDARPAQCRTYPFWPQHLKTKEDWAAAARECEGIEI